MVKRRDIYFRLFERGIDSNNGKKLSWQFSRGKYWLYLRDRTTHDHYFEIRLKGNYIKVYRSYGDGWIHTGIHELILKVKLQNYLSFLHQYEQLTPELQWFEEL